MHALKGHGVEFSIEDFGTGESSLAQLRHLPLDQIKIAQRLVSQMKPGPGQSAMVKTIIGAGRELGLSVLAAGVESAEQREVLRLMGCRLWQGYFCGGPMPLEEFERFGRR
jgi:EAL domain-containing protein (putative c-di-GMP-specific phosphodiesterase class I)